MSKILLHFDNKVNIDYKNCIIHYVTGIKSRWISDYKFHCACFSAMTRGLLKIHNLIYIKWITHKNNVYINTKALKGHGDLKKKAIVHVSRYIELCNPFSRISYSFPRISNSFPRTGEIVLSDCNSIPRIRQFVLSNCNSFPRIRQSVLSICKSFPRIRGNEFQFEGTDCLIREN